MAGNLLHKEDNLFGVVFGFAIGLVQHFHHFGLGGEGTDLVDTLGGKFVVGFNIVVDGHGITISRETCNGEGGVDEGVAAGEGITLGADENCIVA